MTELRLVVADWPDRDDLVVEVWLGDLYIGEGYMDGQDVMFHAHPTSDYVATIDEWMRLLERVRERCLRFEKGDRSQ